MTMEQIQELNRVLELTEENYATSDMYDSNNEDIKFLSNILRWINKYMGWKRHMKNIDIFSRVAKKIEEDSNEG